ncbi:hypothetical protein P2318_25610 [Myxococcaceae bacterium GXIMD 01537]
MSGRQRAKTVVVLEERKAAASAPPAASPQAQTARPVEADPLYGVVLMKAALELKRRRDGSVEDILRGVLARMRIPEAEFFAYLEQHGSLKKALGLR